MSKPPVRYTIMPEVGGAYGWVNETGDDYLGPCHADVHAWCGEYEISNELHEALADWQRVFERGRHEYSPNGIEMDWPRFNRNGLALARRLKVEVGDAARVFYQRPCEDPEHQEQQRREILRDGTTIHWPKVRRAKAKTVVRPGSVISGGQTGVDRAALDWAIAQERPHGGWCPKGRRANDGCLPERYQLRETESPGYAARTRRNVETATTTLLLVEGTLTGGTLLTAKLAERSGARYGVFQIDGPDQEELPNGITGWLTGEDCARLNIAGPSEERCAGIHERVKDLLDQCLSA